MMRLTSSRGPAPSAWKIALCSESTGSTVAPVARRAAHEQAAGADQAFLVGERDGRAALDRGHGRLEADGAADRRHHPVGRTLRRFHQRLLAGGGFDRRCRPSASFSSP